MSNIWEYIDFETSKRRIRIESNYPEHYRRKSTPETQIFTVILPHDCLRKWDIAREKVEDGPWTFVEIFNAFLSEKTGMKVKKDCVRVEERLRRACSNVKAKLRSKAGHSYRTFINKELKMAVLLDDMETHSQIESELTVQKSLVKSLQEKCTGLLDEKVKSQSTEKVASENLSKATSEIKVLRTENEKLSNYIEKLGQDLEFPNNSGKVMGVGERQQRRKLRELKTKVQKALWFAKTFGLDLASIDFTDESGACRKLSYSKKTNRGYKDLSPEDEEKVKSVLYVLDKFCIGDAAYHELTMVCANDELPKSYLIKQCKDDLNKMCHVTRTPGLEQGAQLDFMEELQTVVKEMVSLLFINHINRLVSIISPFILVH